MKEFRDLNKKRVCDLSDDGMKAYIRKGDCVTETSIGKNGKLTVKSEKAPKAS